MNPPRFALVRQLSPAFARAITRHAEPPVYERARVQHQAYVAALRAAGLAVTELPGDPALPDCCFVEDMALIAAGRALLTCSGAPSRRAEREAVAAALPMPRLLAEELSPGATLDGGDCLRVGRRWFVGRSSRTNDPGVEAVRRAFPELEVIAVPVEDLHLKCSVTALSDEAVLLAENTLPPEIFAGLERVMVPEEESVAANVVALGGRVLVAEGFPRTARALAARGFSVVPIAADEIRKADGALSCMSLLWG